MESKCEITGERFVILKTEEEYCRKNEVPFPNVAPIERLRNMLVFRNRMHLYNSKCDYSKKPIISMIPPEKGFVVYDVDVWESDKWDSADYGRGYNFNRTFFEQFCDLLKITPLPSLGVVRTTMENSNYTNGITGAKNCYLIFASSHNEDCLFSKSLWRTKNIVDSVHVFDSELCYECEDIRNSYNLRFSKHCINCVDSYFLYNCQSCSNCYGCINLTNRRYCFFNEQFSEKQYRKKLSEINLGSYRETLREKELFEKWVIKFPIKEYFGRNNENSFGNYISNTKNCKFCYFVSNAENVEYSLFLDGAKSSMFHAMYGNGSELVYNSLSCGDNVYNLKYCVDCWQGAHDLEYCINTSYGANNCFGCVGVKKKSYCILNRQYRKEEYFELLERIKAKMRHDDEYGRFFPVSLSPYCYNRSEVVEFLPLGREEALKRGFSWCDDKKEATQISYTPPDDVKEVGDDVTEKTLVCVKTGKKFKLIRQEVDFHRRNNLALSRVAPLERLKGKRTFFTLSSMEYGVCGKCGQNIVSSYDTTSGRVYCEDCFQKEVYL